MNNRYLYFILIFIAFSCDDIPTHTEIAPSEELVNNDSVDPIKETLVDIQPSIIDSTSSFIPAKATTSNTGFKEYLKTNYELTKHNIIDSAYGEFICTEEFIYSNGITYHYKCGLEGKNDRTTISFPKTELDSLKKLIETLYDEPDNYWETPFNYVPEDVGCWYIINNEVTDSTIVSITCGC